MVTRPLTVVGLSISLLAFAAGTAAQPDPAPVPELLRDFVPVTDAMLREPPPENWIGFRNGYALWGYSPLDQIDAGNVGELRLVWSRAMQEGYQEVEPIVHDGVMFLANVEDIVQALDATTGDLLWQYRRNLPENIANVTGTRYRYRNVSIYGDKIFLATNDAYIVALDARTGELVWGDAAGRLPRAGGADGGADHRQRQGHQRLALQPVEPAPRGLLHHRPRRRQRRGAVARQHRGDAGPVRRRHLGRPAPRRPAARLGVDGGQLRPRAPPRLLGHGAAGAPARVAARGGQGGPPFHQLDPRPRPRTPARWPGTSSTCPATTGTSTMCTSA